MIEYAIPVIIVGVLILAAGIVALDFFLRHMEEIAILMILVGLIILGFGTYYFSMPVMLAGGAACYGGYKLFSAATNVKAAAEVREVALEDGWRWSVGRAVDLDDHYYRPRSGDPRFAIEYCDVDGVVTNRVISPVAVRNERGNRLIYIRAFCHLRQELRTFRSDRILDARDMASNRAVADLGSFLLRRR